MRRFLKYGVGLSCLMIAAGVAYGAKGYRDALRDSDMLRERAIKLIFTGRGGGALGADNLASLLAVEDPGFADHSGVDFITPGAGVTTITQSAA